MLDAQAFRAAKKLEPGDILLVRREQFVGDVGLPGYWHAAGVYIGSPKQQQRFFKSEKDIGERIRILYEKTAPETVLPETPSKAAQWKKKTGGFFKGLNPWKKGVSSSTVSLNEAKPPAEISEPPTVFTSGPHGVRLEKMSRFAAADGLAVLRPKIDKQGKGEALVRCFDFLGKPYDHRHDFRSAAALSGAELVYRVFRSDTGSRNLTFPWSQAVGRWSMSANAIAKKFDAEFGTARQQLEWVLFLDANDRKHISESSTLEEFRKSWRRPKWTFKKENSNEE
jgi:hypothetical protein